MITIQTISFIKIHIFYDTQLFKVNDGNVFFMWHSDVLKHKIFEQSKPSPVGMLQQQVSWYTGSPFIEHMLQY